MGAYEQDPPPPAGQHGLRMAQVWRFPQPLSAYRIGRAGVLPEVQSRPLEQATMRLYRLIGKFARDGRLNQLIYLSRYRYNYRRGASTA